MSGKFWTVCFISMAFATAALGQLAAPTLTSVTYTNGDMNIQIAAKAITTQYAVTVRSLRDNTSTTTTVNSIDRTAGTARLSMLRSSFQPNASLTVTVVAVDPATQSQSAPSGSLGTFSPPAAPAQIAATPGLNKITVQWPAVPGAASYRLTLSNGMSVVTASSPYIFTGLPTATSFNLLMWSYGANGQQSATSTALVVKTANVALDLQ